jgi:phage baseplate assembly protein W
MVNEQLGKDIRSVEGDIIFSNNQDFAISSYENNLWQAIYNRLLTNKGEYTIREYGSELYKAIGQKGNEFLLNRVKGFVVECLKQEPRIRTINNITVSFDDNNRYQINLSIEITPINSITPLNLIFPFFI